MGDGPLELSISSGPNHNADVFRSVFGIDSAQQASDTLNNLDSLFARGDHMWAEFVTPDGQVFPADREGFDATARRVKELYDEGEYQDGELAASQPTEDGQDLWGTSRHAANESSQWKAVCTAPDYCKVGNSVVPFDSYANIGNQTQSSPDVKAQGTPVYRVGDMHKGIEADAGKGIPSGTSQGDGYVKFLTGQDNVKVNGLPMVRQDSLCLVNCNAAGMGGALGKVVTVEKGAQTEAEDGGDEEPNAELQALIDKANDERSFWQKTKDFGSGAWDSTKRIASASWENPLDTGVGVLKGIGNLPSDLWNLGVLGSKYASAGMIPSVAMRADMLNAAALAAHQAGNVAQANALAAQASQMMSSGYVGDIFELSNDAQTGGSVLSMLVPVGAAAKGLGTAGKAARGVKAADTVADAARVADPVTDTRKITDAGRAGVHIAQLSRAERYAELVNSNKPWSWKKDFPNGDKLTAAEKAKIKQEAIERGLIPDVKLKDGTRFPDFDGAGLINKVDQLPENLWKSNDATQFRWLDSRIHGGRPEGFTWHHSEIPGRMELVPFGPHNIINHQGGRSPGMWGAGSR